ncbi:MAG: radical SAM protein [Chrysiogenales bacterium]|nr:radical SAM protein [Candidatus Aminicenantes bacterium]TFG79406.1 MAG: radical SAM protein [Chrysiogenales bacterium]
MQKISSLTLVLSDTCNFSCPYCPQQKGKNTLKIEDIYDFLDLLRPRLDREVWLGFYGGEPLLSWPLIKKTVAYAEKNYKNKFRFTLTTNGSLLKKEHILFFKKYRFDLVLSYDGLAQKIRDARSLPEVETALKNLQHHYPDGYVINSVFTPQTVPLLAASMEEMLKRGHERLQYSLDTCVPWKKADLAILEKQLDRLTTICVRHQQKHGKMPLENFKKNEGQGIFACFAGRDRLALLPDRTVWGCYLFYDLLGHDRQSRDYAKYSFGELEGFMAGFKKGFPAVAANYAELRQDYFFSEKKELCSLCDDLERCAVCPVTAALASGTLAVIPSWTCEVKKIGRRAKARFAAKPDRAGVSMENTHA